MKRFLQILFGTAFLWISLVQIPVQAMNIDFSDAVIDADGGGLTIDHAPSMSEDIFVGVLDIVPGTVITRSYIIQNNYYDYMLYLKAIGFWSIPEELDLIHHIYLELELDGELIYKGDASDVEREPKDEGYGIELGSITKNSSHRLTAVFSVSEELDNGYQEAEAGVDWLFTAIRTEDEEPPEEPNPPKNDDKKKPPGQQPSGPKISSPGRNPKTGDILIGLLFLVILLLLSGLVIHYTKKKKSVKKE